MCENHLLLNEKLINLQIFFKNNYLLKLQKMFAGDPVDWIVALFIIHECPQST